VGKPLVRFCEGLGNNSGTDEILWHRRETRRQTEKTNFILKARGGPSLLESVEAWPQARMPVLLWPASISPVGLSRAVLISRNIGLLDKALGYNRCSEDAKFR